MAQPTQRAARRMEYGMRAQATILLKAKVLILNKYLLLLETPIRKMVFKVITGIHTIMNQRVIQKVSQLELLFLLAMRPHIPIMDGWPLTDSGMRVLNQKPQKRKVV